MKCSTIGKTFAIAAIAALALGIAPAAKVDNKGCSNATLKGTFVHTASGFETAPSSMAGPLVGVGTDTFDGNGGVTTTATLSINGNIVPVTATGTYAQPQPLKTAFSVTEANSRRTINRKEGLSLCL